MSDTAAKAEAKPKSGADVKIVQGRSPAYPYTSLGRALERVEQVRAAGAARGEFPPETFYKLWDMGAQSSSARQTMAALNHYGLVDYIGRGDNRKVKLSDLALKIALDKQPNSSERAAAIKEAALLPAIHSALYERFGALLPADVVLQTYLCRDMGYNEEAAKGLIDTYKDTLSYAGLDKPKEKSDTPFVDNDELADVPPYPKVGSLVQWTSNGTDQFPAPLKVIALSDDGAWLWVTGSQTAIPVKEVTVIAEPAVAPPAPPAVVAAMFATKIDEGSREEKFALKEGDVRVTYPENMSIESIEDLEAYLQVFFKKARREAGAKKVDTTN